VGVTNEEVKKLLSSCSHTSIFGTVIKDKDLLRYVGYCAKLMADDVMVGFRNSMEWRHGGLQYITRTSEEGFFSKCWRIDMNKFKSIWGLMLGI